MRRIVGVVLLAVGAFLVVLAPLVRFHVADQLIAAPANQYSVTTLQADDAQYFNRGKLKVLTGDLSITVTTRGDVSQASGNRVVWDEVVAVNDVTNASPLVSLNERRSAFDKYTGVGIDCCAVNVDKKPVRMEGQIYKFPFDVEKKTYKWFNSVTGAAYDARFVGEDVVNGLPVYRFEQTVPATTTETIAAPASVLGMDETGDVQVDRVYEGTNTVWIEPVSGSPVKQEQRRNEVLKTQDGIERSKAFVATAKMTPESVDTLVKSAVEAKGQITLIRTTIPLVLLVVGVILLVAGFLVVRASGRVRS
ncbi:hypothetical protein FHS43_001030 [Streptosporangium becharense]|uniref:DUF3068 domain-containing protein n=1 Tax=Streptosporangium becharense TaxID=1816182 RepID=A0A7W9IEZ3_9ACTN|nr:DUF3068 domain-containing protein [Streptosporangium becharense]MBB2909784.1 hypothetical protein [Streptosporangium becharense]MBB5819260.1 hypothetical protein [Streptosporangium becharense]